MNMLVGLIGLPLGYVIYGAYRLTGSYGLAILIFAVIAKILVFPVQMAAQKNSIRLLRLQPTLDRIKRRHAGNRELINERQHELFQKEKYSPLIGLVPLFIQLFLIIGIMQVMYNPLGHILHLDPAVIEVLVNATNALLGTTGGPGDQLRVIEAMKDPANLLYFESVLSAFPDAGSIISTVLSVDLSFLGLNLAAIPTPMHISAELWIPLLAGISSWLLCLSQTALSPGALSQGRATNMGLTLFTVTLSIYIAFVTPAGVGLYWSAKNVLGIAAVLLLNKMYDPQKLAGEALAYIKAGQKSTAQRKEERRQNKELEARSRADAARFMAAKKELVFYAISAGQYKYYKNIIEWLLAHSDIVIHYLSNDENDAVFKQSHERLMTYYATQQKTISLLLKLDAQMLLTTVVDLQSFHMKRSIVRSDLEYVFVPHGLAHSHITAREGAYDYFDTIFLVGPYRIANFRLREQMAGLPKKRLVKAGYGVYDQIVESYAAIVDAVNERPRILIAPSWQEDNITELCIDGILEALVDKGYEIVFRPHPQEVKLFPERMAALKERHARHVEAGDLVFETDFSAAQSIYTADILITDWSNIAFEFSYATLKPAIFINTPMKVLNPNYKRYGEESLHLSLRDELGVALDLADIEADLSEIVVRLLENKDAYRARIETVVEQQLYYPRRAGEAGGRYVLNRLKNRNFLYGADDIKLA